MQIQEVTVNLRRWNITEFSTIEEALETLPYEVVLRWLNINWRNYQMLRIANNMKERN